MLVQASLEREDLPAETRGVLTRIRKTFRERDGKGDLGESKATTVSHRVDRIRRVLDREKTKMRASSSAPVNPGGWDGPDAVLDGFAPPDSRSYVNPRFTWYPASEGEGWLQIDLGEDRELSEAGVFWMFDNWRWLRSS